MATTTNYGWTTPDDTALVKDGAAAIRSLGTAIDTSMNTALGTKKSGLVLLNTTSFSAVSSISLPANTFTSTYSAYRIILQIDSTSVAADINLRMRLSGTDDANNLYYSARQNNFTYNAAYFSAVTNPGTSTIAFTSSDVAANGAIGIIDIVSPQEAKRTKAKLLGMGTYINVHGGFLHESNTQFDSMSFIASSGNMTGKVMIYACNQ